MHRYPPLIKRNLTQIKLTLTKKNFSNYFKPKQEKEWSRKEMRSGARIWTINERENKRNTLRDYDRSGVGRCGLVGSPWTVIIADNLRLIQTDTLPSSKLAGSWRCVGLLGHGIAVGWWLSEKVCILITDRGVGLLGHVGCVRKPPVWFDLCDLRFFFGLLCDLVLFAVSVDLWRCGGEWQVVVGLDR